MEKHLCSYIDLLRARFCLYFTQGTRVPPLVRNISQIAHSNHSHLTSRELMNLPLRDPPDVVVGGVGGLLHEEEGDPLEQLVPRHGRHRQVEEQPVQHREGDEVHGAATEPDVGLALRSLCLYCLTWE